MPHLHTILLSKNHFRHINLNAFTNSKDLKAIYLTDAGCIDQDTVDPTKEEIKELIDQLQIRCPPSFEMMQRSIIDSSELRKKIDDRIDSKTSPLEKAMSIIIQNINKIEDRLTNLEPAHLKLKQIRKKD